jgi:photosystem II stability/assembly factor-like uncharacterized protein
MNNIILLILLSIFSLTNAQATDWKLTGFEGRIVNCIAVSPVNKNVIFVGIKDEGIYSTDNAGENWNLVYEIKIPINCIAIDRLNLSNIYAGYNDGIIISNSGGNKFYQTVVEKNINIYSIVLDETQTKAIILGTSKGIYKSFDNGKTFIKAGLNNFPITCLAINNSGEKAIIYAGTDNAGVFKSLNYGTSWAPINKNLTNLCIYSLLCNIGKPSILYLGTLEENIYKSENNGETWEPLVLNNKLNQGYVFAQAIGNTTNNSIIYLTSLSGYVYKITDGNIISKLSEPLKNVYGTCLGITNIVPSTLFLGTTTGLYKFDE